MFTGLTLGQGELSARLLRGSEADLLIEPEFSWSQPLSLGESIAVSGVCLTVTSIGPGAAFRAHASAETLRRTSLGQARWVNLERALALGDRLGGHLVSGHVDGLGRLLSIVEAGSSAIYKFEAPAELMALIAPKGSITVDGVSLTVNEVSACSFTVNLIPHTRSITTLGQLKTGHTVNLEADLIAKYLRRLVESRSEAPGGDGLSLELLARQGFC